MGARVADPASFSSTFVIAAAVGQSEVAAAVAVAQVRGRRKRKCPRGKVRRRASPGAAGWVEAAVEVIRGQNLPFCGFAQPVYARSLGRMGRISAVVRLSLGGGLRVYLNTPPAAGSAAALWCAPCVPLQMKVQKAT